MQQEHNKLKEIIWEITGECKNNCDYCGSKEVNKTKTPGRLYLTDIAKKIAAYPPEEIDISGGDPLLISMDIHKEIVEILKEKNICCKILANPKSIKRLCGETNLEYVLNLFKIYDWVGISINTPEELIMFKSFIEGIETSEGNKKFNHFTIITNFNVVNLYDYEDIESFVLKMGVPWMVQYTIYPKGKNMLAIYEHDSALKKFRAKIRGSFLKSIDVIISDNGTSYPCAAGKHAIGILYNGDVVPCLSMRSWHPDLESTVQGNLHKSDLKDVWTTKFQDYRFNCFVCCKDVCNNEILINQISEICGAPIKQEDPEKNIEKISDEIKKWLEEIHKEKIDRPFEPQPLPDEWWKKWKEDQKNPYCPPPFTVVYSVSPGTGNIMAYACYPRGTSVTDLGTIRLLYGTYKNNDYFDVMNDSFNTSTNYDNTNNASAEEKDEK